MIKIRAEVASNVAGRMFLRLSDSRRLLATAVAALLVLLVSLHVVFGANGMLAYQRKRAESRQLEEQNRKLQQENDRISQRIRELKSDPRAIEKEAREQLRYARPGEVVFTTPEPLAPANAAARKR